ncbi:MAG: hypothetical protein ACD_51C00048G0001 [uncultured bacterium]|nr:MAG: hypothetical protein ACD_51C00048G0001 [uncultured bacterium]OGJ47697.1 MAG: hypothetical protein A2244_03650 [Candidatus Peregrinibacteria bacterium RIFOXYA2_FULL_41_18]OGJ48788.1 MAG: hypothetical protein A2344_01935 [Candidatus Peregrinibacteria bacterium RIFOXYB12_FULL_41_12]OGJ53400.1 MAG: hypothetical protein A2448_02680 [Candidatus Peregrinibacteria bacterium RIFOXYC2_FULL_41_22]
MNARVKKLAITVSVSMIFAVLASALSVFATPQSWQEKVQKSLYSDRPVSEDIVIVYIDDSTLTDEELGRWQDWSRTYYAQVIDNLSAAGAKVIGVDVLFSSKSEGISETALTDSLTSNTTGQELANDLVAYLDENHPDDLILADSIENAGNVFFVKVPDGDSELRSIETISGVSAGEGFAYTNLPQSEVVYKTIFEESLDKKIAEYFSGIESVAPSDELGQFYINYTGPAGSYNGLSFYDVYSGNFNNSDINGKIVLIGGGSPQLQDHYSVPLGENNMYGVEIHANAIQTILDGAYLQDASASTRIATIFATVFVAVFAFMYLNLWATFGAFVVIGLAYWFAAKVAFARGTILDLVYPFLVIVVAYIAAMAIRYFTEVQDKARVRGAFSHYVAKDVVDEILKAPEALKLGGDKKEITIFFADIKNFTNWSESVSPQELAVQLNEYFSALSEIVMRNKGTVDKFIGDAIMAFWGAPLALSNHAEMACETALLAREKLRELNAKWTGEGKKELHFRIGINTGEAIVGNLGSQDRFDYTAIGDNVNLASRLEGANKFYSTEIMISENTYAAVAKKFATRKLDLIRVKGKDQAIAIYELLGGAAQQSELVQEFEAAYALYFKGDFVAAKMRFDELLKKIPTDGPTRVYIGRLDWLAKNPPAKWDGVWEFGEK